MNEAEIKKAEELLEQSDFETWRKYMAEHLTEEDRRWLAEGGIV
jgi:hypothetical protein